MTLDLSTIAQLLYPSVRALDFARIVVELETVLARLRGDAVKITWDCDDLVFFDMPETRILLAWTDLETSGLEGCLTVSVGPGPDSALRTIDSEHDVLCSRLVERIQNRFLPLAIIWRQIEGTIGSDLVDDLIDTLPDMNSVLPPVDSILEALSQTDRSKARQPGIRTILHPDDALVEVQKAAAPKPGPMRNPAPMRQLAPEPAAARTAPPPHPNPGPEPAPAPLVAANDQPDLPLPHNAELARLRLALYPPEPVAGAAVRPQYSTQMRLAAHCFNATLIVVWSPLGAAVMTYSILKGEDMRLSSRMMAVAGTLFALAHSPVGQTVAAMAGVA